MAKYLLGFVFLMVSMAASAAYYEDCTLKVAWTYTPSWPLKKVAHFVGPITAKKGDLLDIRYMAEATNHTKKVNGVGWPIGVGRQVVIGGPVVTVDDVDGFEVVDAQMPNVTTDMHHLPIIGTKLYQLKKDIDGQYVKLLVYGATTSYPNGTLSFEQGYGCMTVEHRPQ